MNFIQKALRALRHADADEIIANTKADLSRHRREKAELDARDRRVKRREDMLRRVIGD